MFFGNGVKNLQAAAYNGARTVTVYKTGCASKFSKRFSCFSEYI